MANAGATCQSVKQPFGRFPIASKSVEPKTCKGPGGRRGLCGGNYPPGWGKPGDQTKKEESPSVVGAAQRLVNMNLRAPTGDYLRSKFAFKTRLESAPRKRENAAGFTCDRRETAAVWPPKNCTKSMMTTSISWALFARSLIHRACRLSSPQLWFQRPVYKQSAVPSWLLSSEKSIGQLSV